MDFGGHLIPKCNEGGGSPISNFFSFFFGGLPSNSGHMNIDRYEEKP